MPENSRWVILPAAETDMSDIWHYGADNWGIEQADRYADGLFALFDLLADFPEMARERTEFDPPVRIHPSAEHLIIYRVEQDRLIILRVLGAGQDWQAILRAADQ